MLNLHFPAVSEVARDRYGRVRIAESETQYSGSSARAATQLLAKDCNQGAKSPTSPSDLHSACFPWHPRSV